MSARIIACGRDYVNATYPGPVAVPVLTKHGPALCDWNGCQRPGYQIKEGEDYLFWKGLTFCAECFAEPAS